MPKLFEKIICSKLNPYISKFVSHTQHGFMKGRSTETNLVVFMNFLLNSMEQGDQVDSVYTDFSKAFDRVHHGLLLTKLCRLSFPLIFIKWLSSYLCGRLQTVRINNSVSSDIKVYSGVPQGSHLGPILFVLYVNDLCDVLTNYEYLFYADDLKIFKRITSIDDTLVLQDNLLAIDLWCKKNYMELNVPKCKCITFSRKRNTNKLIYDYQINAEKLIRCNIMNDLGVLIDEKVTMNDHVYNITNKARRILGLVKRQAKGFNDPYVTKSLYCALVRPILEYCCVVWMPYTKELCNKIESVQKQFLLFALRNLNWNDPFVLPHYEDRLTLISMQTLQDRRTILTSSFMYKLVNDEIDVNYLKQKIVVNQSSYTTRNRNYLINCTHSTDYGMNEPMTRMIRLYNSYYDCFVSSSSVNVFKCKIRSKLKV